MLIWAAGAKCTWRAHHHNRMSRCQKPKPQNFQFFGKHSTLSYPAILLQLSYSHVDFLANFLVILSPRTKRSLVRASAMAFCYIKQTSSQGFNPGSHVTISTISLNKSNQPRLMVNSAKHPKHSKFAIIYRHTRKTNELFLERCPGVNSSSRNNFKSSGFVAKVFIPVYIYNSLLQCAMVR